MTKEELLRALEGLTDECVILIDTSGVFLKGIVRTQYQNIDGEGFLVLIQGDA